jgi:four helix bundle protein
MVRRKPGRVNRKTTAVTTAVNYGAGMRWYGEQSSGYACRTLLANVCAVATAFRLLDAARAIVDGVNNMMARSRRRLLYDVQLRDAVGSIAANIREGYGRRRGPERKQFLRYARASAEEADEHLRANHAAGRVSPKCYWQAHNRLSVIQRMLTSLMGR